MAADSTSHALVIGASGLIGWSVVDQLLMPYPSSSPFRKITALVNRPLELQDSFWPTRAANRPELALVFGVNLLCGDAELENLLKEKVPDVGSVSHVYYFGKIQQHLFWPTGKLTKLLAAFKGDADYKREVQVNVGMMRRVVLAVKSLSPAFKFFVYPGGTRVCRHLFTTATNLIAIIGLWHIRTRRCLRRPTRRGNDRQSPRTLH